MCQFRPNKSHKALKVLCNKFNMVDAWRLQNPTERDYTFYYYPHNSYSCIDYFLISGNATSRIDQSTIEPRVISDHSCITLTIMDASPPPKVTLWIFNKDVLNSLQTKTMIEEAIRNFLIENKVNYTSHLTRWEARKSTIRGVIIKIKSNMNKEANAKLMSLEKDIANLEKEHILNNDPRL